MNIVKKIMKLTLISLLAVTIIAKPAVTYYLSVSSNTKKLIIPFSDHPEPVNIKNK